jgi:murein DD-endopeptidase MepM/ murein hydrolase activator NlpD
MLCAVLIGVVSTAALSGVPATAATPIAVSIPASIPALVTRAHWAWPLRGSHDILRPFIAPSSTYSAGHRGIDIAAVGGENGLAVLAPADGIVHFAGVVVDRGVLSLEHADGILSSYEPVTAVVHKGDAVHRGQVVATLDSGHCSQPCLHFGVRVAGHYVSPLLFLGGVVRPVLLPSRLGTSAGAGTGLASIDLGSRPGMSSRVTLLEPLGRDVRIQLGGAKTRVAEHLLHGAQVGTAVEQVRRRGVP